MGTACWGGGLETPAAGWWLTEICAPLAGNVRWTVDVLCCWWKSNNHASSISSVIFHHPLNDGPDTIPAVAREAPEEPTVIMRSAT